MSLLAAIFLTILSLSSLSCLMLPSFCALCKQPFLSPCGDKLHRHSVGSVLHEDFDFLLQFWKEKVPTLVLTSSSKLCCCHFKPHSNLANWSYGHYPGLEGLQYLCIDSTRKPPVSCPSPCPLPSSSFVLKSETADCDLHPPPDLLKLPLPPEFLQPIIEYVDFMKKELTGALQQMKILEQKVVTLSAENCTLSQKLSCSQQLLLSSSSYSFH